MRRYLSAYPVVLAIFIFFIWLIINAGSQQFDPPQAVVPAAATSPSSWAIFITSLAHAVYHPLSILILQLVTILIATRIMSWLVRQIGQPAVIGEILAGILLGPSLVGMLFPEFYGFLFAPASHPNLQMLSQLGLVLFMFTIGMELDITILKTKAHTALLISHFSIAFMHLVGALAAFFLYTRFAGESATFFSFAWFLGISMSITAFPVLARIVQERNMTKTALGTITITCAAADDVTAWCILAMLIAWVKASDIGSALFTLGAFAIYISLMIYVIQPFLKRVGEVYASREVIGKPVVAMIFLLLFGSAYVTEIMGIHALFGAFLAGVIMPQNSKFKEILTHKIEDVSSVLLLPLFFVFTGLRTQIGLLNSIDLWLMALLIIVIATSGKVLGVMLTARFLGQKWQDSLTLGVLMNTRGLMELIVLNIGYELGILSPEIFAMMVLMALATTFTTGPLLDLIEYTFGRAQKRAQKNDSFNVVLSFGQPQMGSSLLKIANLLSLGFAPKRQISALHLTPSTEVSLQEATTFEEEGFAPLLATADELHLAVQPVYKVSEKVSQCIINISNEMHADLLLLGSARSIFNQTATSGIIRQVLDTISCESAILIEKELDTIDSILILTVVENDAYLLEWGERIAQNTTANVRVMDIQGKIAKTHRWVQKNPNVLLNNSLFAASLIQQYDLIIVGFEYWDSNPTDYEEWQHNSPSILIMRPPQPAGE